MKNKITVMITDDHPLWRKAIIDLLKTHPEFEVIGEANNGGELIELIKEKIPDVILLDIRMPVMGGEETLKKIKENHPNIYVIILSEYCYDDAMIIYYIENGASSAVAKSATGENLVGVIISVIADEPSFTEKILKELLRRDGKHNKKNEKLTEQEKNILMAFCEEKSIKEVAAQFYLSVGTIKHHKTNIYRKTKSINPAGLAKYAFKRGWL
jgi:DNA-binding NarL/FixJ family response regulator